MVKTIDTKELEQRLDDEKTVLLDVLGPDDFKRGHLPGAHNVPVDASDFKTRVHDLVPDQDTPIIVYCQDQDCQASPKAAKRLESLGYTDVMDYEAGKKGWREAGHRFDGEKKQIRADVE